MSKPPRDLRQDPQLVLGAGGWIRDFAHTLDPALAVGNRAFTLAPGSRRRQDYVRVFRIHGPFLFGATDKIGRITDHVNDLGPIVIVRLRNMTAIDATGLRALEDLADRLHAAGRALILCGAPKQPAALMQQSEFHQHVGADNVCPNIKTALERAAAIRVVSPEAAAPRPVSTPSR